MATSVSTPAVPAPARGVPVRLGSVREGLWRVIDARGRIIGHLEARPQEGGIRYRVLRFHPASRTLRALGDFWSAEDAIDSLRFSG